MGAAPPDGDSSTVVVWLFGLNIAPETEARLRRLLCPQEKARADRLRCALARSRHLAAHAAKRLILGQATGAPPAALQFAFNPWGKPELTSPRGPQFNLSHAGDLGALAICWRCPVGVDVEEIRPIDQDVADAVFSAAEIAALAQLPAAQRLPAFYRCWTCKEAVTKALGHGLAHEPGPDGQGSGHPSGQPSQDFDVAFAPGRPLRMLRMKGDADAASRWLLADLQPGHGYTGVVAAPDPGLVVAVRRWTPPLAAQPWPAGEPPA